jgi:hypothetical protein
MIRRGISIVVLLGYLAGQVVMVPHAHAGQSPVDGHSLAPHVHVLVCGICHQHHRHGHHGHGDAPHEHAANDHTTSDSRQGDSVLADECDHDADAVYVPTVIRAVRRAVETNTVDVKAQPPTALSSCIAFGNFYQPSASLVSRYPDTAGRHCALYLTLGALRI